MKSLKEIRNNHNLQPSEVCSSTRYFKKLNIDWNVFLPSIGRNLQRDFVWNIEQKRELIFSILIGRHIPHCAVINIINPLDEKSDIYQIIDGKQRLSSIFDFMDNKFSIKLENREYLFSELPDDYKLAITNFNFRYYIVNEEIGNVISDEQKIAWFKFINYAGTPQDIEHLNSLK